MEKMRKFERGRAFQVRKKERKVGPAVVFLVISVVMFLGLLSSLRGDTNRIENRLSEVNRRIAAMNEELRELERQATALTSPSVVYANTVEKMGMNQVHLAGTIHVLAPSTGTVSASLPELPAAFR